jgi:hypothetical protein
MMAAAHRIPLDIIREIVSYMPDIDVRRAFGIYGKLDLTNYSGVSKALRPSPPVDNVIYQHYSLQNAFDPPTRRDQSIENDMLDITIKVQDDGVHYSFYLFRLKPKTGDKQKEQLDVFHKGTLDDWYWDYSYYCHRCK